jgi:uncharacterized lipoprotein YddW (UPF0748 family)
MVRLLSDRRKTDNEERGLRTMPLLLLLILLVACGDPPSGPPSESPAEEARALWVSRFEYGTAADIDSIIARTAITGFNVIVFQVRGAGDAFYDSDLEPCAVALCGSLGNGHPSWDPLAVAVAAHAREIQLHARINALSGWGAATPCVLPGQRPFCPQRYGASGRTDGVRDHHVGTGSTSRTRVRGWQRGRSTSPCR